MTAHFVEGEPANLEAAAMDALEWLRWMQVTLRLRGQGSAKLARAIIALEKYLPNGEPIYDTIDTTPQND